jgi:hypothetical protein
MVFLSGLLAGCAAEPPRVDSGQTIEIKGDMDRVFRICQDELKNRGFELDRVDRRDGWIETFPMTSAQWFEFWRGDVVGDYAWAESNLQTVQRRVKMTVSTMNDQNVRLLCEVSVERREADSERVQTMGPVAARDLFSVRTGRIPGLGEGKSKTGAESQWTPLGNDPELEHAILQRITTKISG